MMFPMMYVQNLLKILKNREEGQGMVEYALIVALISIAAIAILPDVGAAIVDIFTQIEAALANA